jgi:enterochelin esterase family protein
LLHAPRRTEHLLTSELLTDPRRAWIHPADGARDCLLFLDGELYTERVMAPEVLATAQSQGSLPPLTCVYIPNLSAADRHAIYTCNERHAAFIALEIPRWIEGMAGRFERLFLCGLSLSALQCTYTVLRHPDIFAGVLAQSPSAWWQEEKLADSLEQMPDSQSRFWLSVGSQEVQEHAVHAPTPLIQNTSQLASVRHLADRLTQAGHAVRHHEYEGGHDPACWRAELPLALDWLLRSSPDSLAV